MTGALEAGLALEWVGDAGEVSLCSIRMGTEWFGIDAGKVREVLGRTRLGSQPGTGLRQDLRPVPLAPAFVAGVIPYRGDVLTTLSLGVLLGLADCAGRADGCVLVLDDEELDERLGLLVDGVGGVVRGAPAMFEANPSTLDARRLALCDGVYKLPGRLMARLDPVRLQPRRLEATALFGEVVRGG